MKFTPFTKRSMYLAGLLATVVLLAIACHRPVVVQEHFLTAEELGILPNAFEGQAKPSKNRRGPCNQVENYEMDTTHLDHFPDRLIRVNFHWMNSEDGSQNIPENEALAYTKQVLHAMNYAMKNNKKMWIPHGNNTPVHPTKIQYVLTGRPDVAGDEGVYYHYDDSLYYYVHIRNKDANLFDRTVVRKYGVQLDTVLNFFMMPHHPDSVKSKTYSAGYVGVALGRSVKVAAQWREDKLKNPEGYWAYRGYINHEVGHILGVNHAWTKSDGCDDTPVHANRCWDRNQPGCDTLTSNNVMDYTALQLAWTPCQIARMHRRLADDRKKPRRFLVPTWCELKEEKNIVITDSITWPCIKDIEGNIHIAEGGHLRVLCPVSMPPNSQITIGPEGKLTLDGGRLYQDCEQSWKGILIQEQGEHKGAFEMLNGASIADVDFEQAGLND